MKIRNTVLLITILTLIPSFISGMISKEMEMDNRSRKAAFAGSFYPRDPDDLESAIRNYLEKAEPETPGGVIRAIVSPHAGYVYSGQTAAYGYKSISGNSYESVIVISPSHRESFDYSSIYDGDAYLTPLGEVPVDRELS
ncbi:MAG: AmmeMemoRadiSam system protein B, partial [Candidatus Latescibacteria bacterium]|nr:AmmeMemoRadiSam system protein B [bacterium]MBD3424070.1 AmmeMemoRadiSam system protein B [Candidatus Latescibacterota bacterium]